MAALCIQEKEKINIRLNQVDQIMRQNELSPEETIVMVL